MKEKNTEKKERRNVSSGPEVVYTQPEPVNRKKLILRLLTVCAVVLALFVGFSIFFRVDTIEVSGIEQYTADTVMEASGVEYGASLLTFGKSKACARIKNALPYVETIRIGIKLPGTVRIYITEVDVVYSVQDASDGWWFMTSEGRIIEKVSQSRASQQTLIKGIRLVDPKVGKTAVAMEPEPEETYVVGDEEQQTIVTVTNGERLQTVLDILVQLEKNEILGEVSSVDVTDMGSILLWYDSKAKVLLGDPGQMEDKISILKGIMAENHSGIIDLTHPENDEAISIVPFE